MEPKIIGEPAMNKPAKTIARCSKCGREFVWLAPNCDMIDKYSHNSKYKYLPVECGGEIKLLETVGANVAEIEA